LGIGADQGDTAAAIAIEDDADQITVVAKGTFQCDGNILADYPADTLKLVCRLDENDEAPILRVRVGATNGAQISDCPLDCGAMGRRDPVKLGVVHRTDYDHFGTSSVLVV
jgi:hypothetical protein